jgi:hypothetical protein
MNEPFSFVVSLAPWNVFSTLTYKDVPSERLAKRHLEKWLRWVAHISEIKFSRLLFLARLEKGEVGRRLHLHILIVVPETVMGYFVTPPGCVPMAHKIWGRGLTRFRRVEGQDDPAVAYLLKETSGADSYELAKTAKGQQLVISNALIRYAKCRKRVTGSAGTMNQSG